MRLPSIRRSATVAATALLLLLAACGGGSEPAAPSSSATAADAFPVSIEHRYGTTTIPAEPKRIAVVGLVEQDALLSLGVVPVATTEWFGEKPGAIWPWAETALGSAAKPQVLTNTDGVQFEKVAALRPDLILGIYSGLTSEDYAKLAKIAPTVAQPKNAVDYGDPGRISPARSAPPSAARHRRTRSSPMSRPSSPRSAPRTRRLPVRPA